MRSYICADRRNHLVLKIDGGCSFIKVGIPQQLCMKSSVVNLFASFKNRQKTELVNADAHSLGFTHLSMKHTNTHYRMSTQMQPHGVMKLPVTPAVVLLTGGTGPPPIHLPLLPHRAWVSSISVTVFYLFLSVCLSLSLSSVSLSLFLTSLSPSFISNSISVS